MMDRLAMACIAAFALAGCAASATCNDASCADAGSPGCVVDYSGNFSEHREAASCGGLQRDDTSSPAHWKLALTADSASAGNTRVSIDLGPSPSAGTFTEASISSWSAVAVSRSGCELSAGSDAVPQGAFTLTLRELTGLDGAPQAHGTLELQEHVSAPAGVDCGAGDTEQVSFAF